MGISGGPKISTDNLLFTFQPGQTTSFGNFTSSLAPDTSVNRGAAIGPRRVNEDYGNVYDDNQYYFHHDQVSVIEIQNLTNSVYQLNTAATTTYTISLWVKIVSFPTKYDGTKGKTRNSYQSTKSKRAALARFNYTTDGNPNGQIEFGAMAPYYTDDNDALYKSVFEPISFGVSIKSYSNDKIWVESVYTDYKFNLNKWYLVTIQLDSNSNMSVLTNQTMNKKIFVNGIQENVAYYGGIPWNYRSSSNNTDGTSIQSRRKRGAVAGGPGFYNCYSRGVVNNFPSVLTTFRHFFNLANLNYISFSPIKKFIGDGSSKMPKSFFPYKGSGINFGQTYIYNKQYDNTLYTNFKSLYS
jgi:hypothetical protein